MEPLLPYLNASFEDNLLFLPCFNKLHKSLGSRCSVLIIVVSDNYIYIYGSLYYSRWIDCGSCSLEPILISTLLFLGWPDRECKMEAEGIEWRRFSFDGQVRVISSSDVNFLFWPVRRWEKLWLLMFETATLNVWNFDFIKKFEILLKAKFFFSFSIYSEKYVIRRWVMSDCLLIGDVAIEIQMYILYISIIWYSAVSFWNEPVLQLGWGWGKVEKW